MSHKGIVLVTGANGYIAGRVIASFLAAGYAVRGTARSKAKTEHLVKSLSQYGDRLEIVEIPDIITPGAFDDAVKGVHAIAHLASPVVFEEADPTPILKAARDGTTEIMKSAIKEPSVKTVVHMSSLDAIYGFKDPPHLYTEEDWNTGVFERLKNYGPNPTRRLIYSSSKVAAEQAFWSFGEEKKPGFTMTAINPSYVIGPYAALESPSMMLETTSWIWDVFSGKDFPDRLMESPPCVDIRDVSRAVVFSVDNPQKTDGERFIISKGVAVPQAAADVLRDAYPERRDIIKVGNPGEGYSPGFEFNDEMNVDGSKFVRVTGQELIPIKQAILDMAKWLEQFL